MREYHKIETLFERDKATFAVDPTKVRLTSAKCIKDWLVTEKVDGTNIRITLTPALQGVRKVVFGGKTDNAQLPMDLVRYMQTTFTVEKMMGVLTEDNPLIGVTLYGEGYGPGIQKGGYYRDDKAVVLFDAAVFDGEHFWWQDDATVTKFAKRMEVQRVPILGLHPLNTIVEMVRDGIPSRLAKENHLMEGVVARPLEPLFDRRGTRIIIKLKTCDFKKGEQR